MIVRLAACAMATRFELALAGEDETHLRAVGEEALEEVHDCERRLSRFAKESLLTLVNEEAARRWVRVDGDTFELLERCTAIQRESDGAFDVTIGPLMSALGFHAPAGGETDVAAALAQVGGEGLLLDRRNCALRFARPGLSLDLGAVGKGHALDRAADVLREHGVDCALLHGGTSSAVALGAPPGKEGWRIALGRERPAAVALLRDAALAVSAPHGRTVEGSAGAHGHVLDPRTGRSADGFAFVAVIHESAREADAWSTALLVGGEELARRSDRAALFATREERTAMRWSTTGVPPAPSRFELPAPELASTVELRA